MKIYAHTRTYLSCWELLMTEIWRGGGGGMLMFGRGVLFYKECHQVAVLLGFFLLSFCSTRTYLCFTKMLSNDICFCLCFTTYMKWNTALSLYKFITRFATSLWGRYFSMKSCISSHFPSVSWISEVEISFLPTFSSEESSLAAFCCCSSEGLEFLDGELSVTVLHQLLHIITHLQAHRLAQRLNILHNRHIKAFKVSFSGRLRPQFLTGWLHGPGRHFPPCFVYEPQGSEDIKMSLPELRRVKLVSEVTFKHLWNSASVQLLRITNDLLVHGLAERSNVRCQEPHSDEGSTSLASKPVGWAGRVLSGICYFPEVFIHTWDKHESTKKNL